MPVETHDIPPFPDGMNTQEEPWAIPDTMARYIQDAVLHKPNELNRRGPVREARDAVGGVLVNPFDLGNRGIGLAATEQPNEVWRVAVLHGSAAGAFLGVYSVDYQDRTNITLPGVFDPDIRYAVHVGPHMWGGVIIGVSRGYLTFGGLQYAIHWYGADKPLYSTGTITVAQDGTTVTGSGTAFSANIVPGMFLFADADSNITGNNKSYLGIVKSVTNDTTLTLMEGSLYAVTGRTYKADSTRSLSRRTATGVITTTTASAQVTGSLTKFKNHYLDEPTGAGKWAIFRASDMKRVGWVNSVTSNTVLTLTGAASVTMNKEPYVAIDTHFNSTNEQIDTAREPGWMSAQWAGRQWYANRRISNRHQPLSPSRVWFSSVLDPEAVDYAADGSHILIPNTKPPIQAITAIAPTPSALVVFKEDETWGVFGTDETNFAVKHILNDGCFTPMAVQQWNDGIVWAGKKGLWFFDGQETFNMIEDRFQKFYSEAVAKFPNRTKNAWSMLHENHYIVYIENTDNPFGPLIPADRTSTAPSTDPSTSGTPQDYLAICINLENRALTLFTNFAFRGAVRSPDEDVLGTLYLVNTLNSATFASRGARLCNAQDLFEVQEPDELFTEVRTPATNKLGPDLYIESKRYDMGEPQLKKNMKQLQMLAHIKSATGAFVATGLDDGPGEADYNTNYLAFSTVSGLNENHIVARSRWRITRTKIAGTWFSGWSNKRIKFLKRTQHLGFRIWQSNVGPTTIQSVSIGPMAIGFKWLRKGKV